MELRKIFLIIGLILAPLSGGLIYYLYHFQTKEIAILQIKSDLGYAVQPGTQITNALFEQKIVLQKDLPLDPMLPGSVGDKVYASKYLYPADPLLSSKVMDQPLAFKDVNQRIIAIKPSDLGLMGLIELDDLITIITPVFSLPNVRVVGITDSSGNIISIIPQFGNNRAEGGYLQNLAASAQTQVQAKSADHLLILVTKENADIISKLPKESITIVFESRPSLPDSK